jgi:hypothetical protein
MKTLTHLLTSVSPFRAAGVFRCAIFPLALSAHAGTCDLTWLGVQPSTSPGLLVGRAVAYDSARHVAVFFGGDNPNTGALYTNDTWEFNGSTWSLRPVANRPSLRKDSAMVYDSARGVCVLFGGGANIFVHETPDNDTWEWNGSVWTLRVASDPAATDRPPPLEEPIMVYDSLRGKAVLTGGSVHIGNSVTPVTKTWEWNGANWKAIAAAPPPRVDAAMTYDSARGVTVLFGGSDFYATGNYGDTWAWNGAIWVRVATGGPPARNSHAMAFDARRGVVVLFGGMNADIIDTSLFVDTWEWNGTAWSFISTAGRLGLTPRRWPLMWYDSGDQKLTIFGGTYSRRNGDGSYTHTILADVWEGRPPGTWVSFGYAGKPSLPEVGDFYQPFNTLGEGVNAAASGCTLLLQPGTRAEPITITKPLTLEAYTGPVTLR